MWIAIEGPHLLTVDFDPVLDIYEQQNHGIVLLSLVFNIIMM